MIRLANRRCQGARARLVRVVRNVLRDETGAISILGTAALAGLIACAALVLEYGSGLLQQIENQRAADVAAYAGAVVYSSTGSSTSATSAVNNVAALNGLSGNAASSVVNSPTGDGNEAVNVSVTTSAMLNLAKVVSNRSSLPVVSSSYAEVGQGSASDCIIALSGSGTGISLSGTGSITADACKVASNGPVCANSGANPSDVITTKYLSYDTGTNPNSSSCTLTPPSGSSSVNVTQATVTNPLASNSAVSTAAARLGLNASGSCAATAGTVCAIASPSVIGGTAITFAYSKVSSGMPSGCTDSYPSSGVHDVSCTGTGPFNFGAITLSGGTTVTFGSGSYTFGTTTCSGTANVSICNTGTSLTFTGPDILVLAGSIYNGGGASMALGSGSSSNSYDIGEDGGGYSINVGTSKIMTFGDATGAGDVFETAGTISSGGGSCLALPATTEHDINGSILAAGGLVMGAGIYTVDGSVSLGNGGGGDASNCPTSGTTTGLTALGVTIVVGGARITTPSGASPVSCGSISSTFCVGAGYNTVKLTAPTSGSTAQLAVIGPQTTTDTAGATFTSGASNTQISGAFYFPNGPINLSGAATLHDTVDTGACLELIGTSVTASAGTSTGSSCSGLGSSIGGAPRVGLIQ
jgi:hypothetical protein